ncbi:lysylphosphatidylglycerol synthase domain-containing protein [Streptomyces sp. ST2-7A]|uniref:lysylphosphatidylglycerol synthase domain-containing protein n=1 Tax=Streptomyces sp. ST2-7A TaxID=2907214 RepID=UPI001F2AE0A7|nr:lysylphosphatidylglycerol synthase domain-containing protein [Streptomyces sp. ST2-7A]MCE7079793.1 lysylphosphatidylglycerol synthase domain-containing protein [Streptomyces sp. ST2-7A]
MTTEHPDAALPPAGPAPGSDDAGTVGRETAPARPRHGAAVAWRRALTVIFAVAVVAGVLVALRGQDWSVLAELLHGGSAAALLGACLVTAVGLLCGTRAWLLTLSAIAAPVPARTGIRMFFVGFLGKFVPGRVWGLIAQMRMAEQAGVTKTQMAGTYLVNLVIVLLTGGVVGLLVARTLPADGAVWLLLPPALLLVLVVRPDLIHVLAGLAARVAGRQPPPPPGRSGNLRLAIVFQTAAWVLSGLHVWVIAVLLGAEPLPALPAAIGGFALAVVVGSLAVFAPDGIGVRELLLVPALAPVLPLHAAVAAALGSRVLTLIAELATSGVALGVVALRDRPAVPTPFREESTT